MHGVAFARKDIVELRLQRGELRAVAALNRALISRLIEKHGGLFELIEKKNHRAEEEDEKLHRHFHDRVEEQTDPARAQRTAGEITLHLRLVGAEIREREEEPAENPRPDSVAPGGIEGKIDRLEFSHFPRNGKGAAERQVVGQTVDRDAEGEGHADEDDQDLITLGEADDLGAADNRVSNDESAREPDGEIQVPTEQRGKNNGRRIDRDAGGDPALNQKQERAEQSRFLVEALAEIFVGGENFQPLINRNKDRADRDEREGLAEIILDESDSAFVGLPRHGEERDRAGLGREDGKADGSPADGFVALEILAKGWVIVGAQNPVEQNGDNRRQQDDVIEPVHENRRVKA